jgi:hypothetical protein
MTFLIFGCSSSGENRNMLNRTIKQMSAVLAGVTLSFGLATAALAIPLTGNITIGGQVTPDFNTHSVTFTDIGAGPENGFVNGGAGDLTTLAPLTTPVIYTAFAYDGSALPINPLWTDAASGLSFELVAVTSWSDDSVAGTVDSEGTGTMTAPGFDPTPFAWSFSVDSPQGVFSFSSTNVATPTPEPATLGVLGIGLLGLGFAAYRRRRDTA